MAKAAAAAAAEIDPRRTLTLDEILGNEPLRRFLRRAWRDGVLPQSLLLAGPAGIGKTTLAYSLLREIAAQGEDPKTQRHALKLERGAHPDMIEVTSGDSVSGQIKVDLVRDMEARVGLMPTESPRKMILIEPAEALNLASANALLKLLEEPPSSALFILISPDPNRLLVTIRSRCTVLELRPVPVDELTEWLVKQHRAVPERARLAAALSEGRPGYARALLEGGLLEQRAEVLRWLTQLAGEGFAGLFGVADRFASTGGSLSNLFQTVLLLLRDVLALKMAPTANEARLLNHDLRESLEEFAASRDPAGVLAAAEAFERAAAEAPYFYGPQPKLLFCEALLMQVGPGLRAQPAARPPAK